MGCSRDVGCSRCLGKIHAAETAPDHGIEIRRKEIGRRVESNPKVGGVIGVIRNPSCCRVPCGVLRPNRDTVLEVYDHCVGTAFQGIREHGWFVTWNVEKAPSR
jgi:hypothetical protein